MIEKSYPRLWAENKTVEASLLSIDFINYVKKNKLEKAVELLGKPPLARPHESIITRAQNYLSESMFCQAHRGGQERHDQALIVSADRRGARIFLKPDELTKLFCFESVWEQGTGADDSGIGNGGEKMKLSKH